MTGIKNLLHRSVNNRISFLYFFTVAVVQLSIVVYVYHFHTSYGLSLPLSFGGDGLLVMAIGQAVSDGGLIHGLNLTRLYYPSGVILDSHYPVPEKLLFAVYGLLVHQFDVHSASKVLLTVNHIFIAMTSYWCLSRLKIERSLAILLAIVFASAPFVFTRGLGHVVIAVVFHLPVLAFFIFKHRVVFRPLFFDKHRFFILSWFVAAGALSPYYWTLSFISFSIIIAARYRTRGGMSLKSVFLALSFGSLAFVICNYQYIINLPFSSGSIRDLASLEVYGLKIPELFLPYSHPTIEILAKASHLLYYNRAFIKGEVWGPFLGLPTIILLFTSLLLLIVSRGWNKREGSLLLLIFVSLAFLFSFSLVGGFNQMLGTFGFAFLRATNRFSIVIQLLLLVGAGIVLTAYLRRCRLPSIRLVLIAVVSIFLFFDLPRNFNEGWYHATNNEVRRYVEYSSILTKDGPASVLTYPRMFFPENGPRGSVPDYEPLKFLLTSRDIALEYGAPRVPTREVVASELPPKLSVALNNHSHLVVFKRGYEDKKSLLTDQESFKRDFKLLFEDEHVLIYDTRVFKLKGQMFSSPMVEYYQGWSTQEPWGRWSTAKHASLRILDFPCILSSVCSKKIISLNVQSFGGSRELSIFVNGSSVETVGIGSEIKSVSIDLPVGSGRPILIDFRVSGGLKTPGGGDFRRLSFAIHGKPEILAGQ